MERRTVLAFFLIFLVLLFWNLYLLQQRPPTKGSKAPQVERKVIEKREAPPEKGEEVLLKGEDLKQAPSPILEEEAVVENPLYQVRFSSIGGTITSFKLKKYRDPNGNWVELIPPGKRALTLSIEEGGKTLDLSELPFEVNRDTKTGNLEFLARTHDLEVRKVFRFWKDREAIELEIQWRTEKEKAYWLSLNSGLSVTEKNEQEDLGYFACLGMFGEQIESQGLKGFKKETTLLYTGNIGWAGVRTKYFLSSLIPQGVRAEAIKFEKLSEHSLNAGLKRPLSPSSSDLYTIYFGPIEYKRLEALGVGLERVCDTGWRWIRPISRLILQLLLLLHRVFPNFGVVIILFSIIMKVLFFPLSYLSLKSMREMQKLHPKLAELKERFKGDPARLNRETMELYRKHKVNPLGGCLPMLIQIPIFFALYNVLQSMVELRGASFIFWIRDLSQKDPYLILPILMGITMFIQQKISTKDPRQRGMMYLIPVVMTFIFLSFPAGLNLYFLITNLLSIGETIFVQYKTKEVIVKA